MSVRPKVSVKLKGPQRKLAVGRRHFQGCHCYFTRTCHCPPLQLHLTLTTQDLLPNQPSSQEPGALHNKPEFTILTTLRLFCTFTPPEKDFIFSLSTEQLQFTGNALFFRVFKTKITGNKPKLPRNLPNFLIMAGADSDRLTITSNDNCRQLSPIVESPIIYKNEDFQVILETGHLLTHHWFPRT